MKKKIDVEKLLSWAVNDELPKGQPIFKDIRNILAQSLLKGHRRVYPGVRKYIEQRRYDFLQGEAHPDAVEIGKLLVTTDPIVGLASRGDAEYILKDLVKIDPHCVLAALAVSTRRSEILLRCAIARSPPPLDPRLPRAMPEKRTNGKPVVLREDADGDLIETSVKNWRNDYAGAPRCTLEWADPTAEAIAEQRAEYAIWYQSLIWLAAVSGNSLRDYEALPPSRSEFPWRQAAPAVQPGRLLGSLS